MSEAPPALAARQAPASMVVVNAASYSGLVARGSIAAAYGSFNTNDGQPFTASTRPLPWSLGGVRVTVSGRPAQLFYASPAQINILIPPLTDAGVAVVKVSNADNTDVIGRVTVLDSAPGVFTATSSGRGTAAAVTTFDGLSYASVANADGSESDVDPGTQASPNYLVLYATGVRFGPSQALTVHVQGILAQVPFVGRAPGFDGLDQINVVIPPNLSGMGSVSVQLTVAGRAGNIVKIKLAGGLPPLLPRDVALGQTLSGALTTESAVDKAKDGIDQTYFFDAYQVTTTSPDATLAVDLRSAEFNPLILFYRKKADGELDLLAADERTGGLGEGRLVNDNALLLTVVREPGDYIIKVTSSDVNVTGSYSLGLAADVARPISYGAEIDGALVTGDDLQTSGGDYLDVYWFSGRKGEGVQVKMSSTAFDPFLIVLNNSGERVWEDDNSGGGVDAQVNGTLPSDGVYLILATPFAVGRTGPYQLTLVKTGEAPPASP